MKGIKQRLSDLEQFMIDLIYDRRKGFAESIVGSMLRVLSYVFNAIVQTRFFLYRNRILRDQPLGCLVVVVGNLTVGGTGKTPVVEKFARNLVERGRKVAILSRGYGSRKERKFTKFWRWLIHRDPTPPRIVSDGTNVLLDSKEAGDEPFMLASNLPGVIVLVDKNRVNAGTYAIKRFGVDTLLLDDGFQYLPIRGQLNLLMVDKGNPFGNHCMLPRGILREPVKHLKRASYIFLTKSDGKKDEELDKLIHHHCPDTEIIECAHVPKYLKSVFSEESLPLSHMKGKRVASFSGIAVPEGFEAFLREHGATIVYNQRFLDHHRFTKAELAHLFENAIKNDAEFIVTTEKDAVRIEPSDTVKQLPFYFLRLEVELLSGADDFDQAVSRICFPKKDMRSTRSAFLERDGE